MAKNVEFEEFTATTKDDDGDEHESSVWAHVVNDESAGEYRTRTGTQNVQSGNVLVETDREGVYDVLSKEQWKDTGYGGGDDSGTEKESPAKPTPYSGAKGRGNSTAKD